jgi:hypothetical protein
MRKQSRPYRHCRVFVRWYGKLFLMPLAMIVATIAATVMSHSPDFGKKSSSAEKPNPRLVYNQR